MRVTTCPECGRTIEVVQHEGDWFPAEHVAPVDESHNVWKSCGYFRPMDFKDTVVGHPDPEPTEV